MNGYVSYNVLMTEADYRAERLLAEADQERLAHAVAPRPHRLRSAVVAAWRRFKSRGMLLPPQSTSVPLTPRH